MSFWKGKKVLVTGATGLIGGWLCKLLLEQGASVEGYDTEPLGTLRWHNLDGKFTVHDASILSGTEMVPLAMWEVMKGKDAVFHLAANSGVDSCTDNGYSAFRVNILGTMNVLEACRQTQGIKSVLVASSNHIYGEQLVRPTPETAPLNQLDTYSASKTCADYLGRAYAHNYGVPTVIARNTNCYGPCDPHVDHIIPSTILSLLRDERPVIRTDGQNRKSYIHVKDVARAYLMMSKWVAEGGEHGKPFNASGPAYSVRVLVDHIIRAYGTRTEPLVKNAAYGLQHEDLDSSELERCTGWKPVVPLGEGLTETIRWFREWWTSECW
jgi:CDP-glucose 4,6-dehydratase